MVASDTFAEFLRDQLATLLHVKTRRMFGKTGVFCDRFMFGVVAEDTLYFRVDDHNRATFKEAESFPLLSYEKKGRTIDLSFWRAPDRLLDEPDEFVMWSREAMDAARRVAAKSARKVPQCENPSLNQREVIPGTQSYFLCLRARGETGPGTPGPTQTSDLLLRRTVLGV